MIAAGTTERAGTQPPEAPPPDEAPDRLEVVPDPWYVRSPVIAAGLTAITGSIAAVAQAVDSLEPLADTPWFVGGLFLAAAAGLAWLGIRAAAPEGRRGRPRSRLRRGLGLAGGLGGAVLAAVIGADVAIPEPPPEWVTVVGTRMQPHGDEHVRFEVLVANREDDVRYLFALELKVKLVAWVCVSGLAESPRYGIRDAIALVTDPTATQRPVPVEIGILRAPCIDDMTLSLPLMGPIPAGTEFLLTVDLPRRATWTKVSGVGPDTVVFDLADRTERDLLWAPVVWTVEQTDWSLNDVPDADLCRVAPGTGRAPSLGSDPCQALLDAAAVPVPPGDPGNYVDRDEVGCDAKGRSLPFGGVKKALCLLGR